MIKYSLIALYITGGIATILCFWMGLNNYDKAIDLKNLNKMKQICQLKTFYGSH